MLLSHPIQYMSHPSTCIPVYIVFLIYYMHSYYYVPMYMYLSYYSVLLCLRDPMWLILLLSIVTCMSPWSHVVDPTTLYCYMYVPTISCGWSYLLLCPHDPMCLILLLPIAMSPWSHVLDPTTPAMSPWSHVLDPTTPYYYVPMIPCAWSYYSCYVPMIPCVWSYYSLLLCHHDPMYLMLLLPIAMSPRSHVVDPTTPYCYVPMIPCGWSYYSLLLCSHDPIRLILLLSIATVYPHLSMYM